MRVTYCFGIRMDDPEIPALLVGNADPASTCVIEEGMVEGLGMRSTKVVIGPERMSVSEVDALLYPSGHLRD